MKYIASWISAFYSIWYLMSFCTFIDSAQLQNAPCGYISQQSHLCHQFVKITTNTKMTTWQSEVIFAPMHYKLRVDLIDIDSRKAFGMEWINLIALGEFNLSNPWLHLHVIHTNERSSALHYMLDSRQYLFRQLDKMIWKHFPLYWSFMGGIQRLLSTAFRDK